MRILSNSDLRWVSGGTGDSNNPPFDTDQTASHDVSSEEAWMDFFINVAAAGERGQGIEEGMGGNPELGPLGKESIYVMTHPGWMNQDDANYATYEDFAPGGALENSYGAEAPYSIDHGG